MSVCVCSLTRDNEDVPILVPVVGSVARCTITDCEPGSLVADQLKIFEFGFAGKKHTFG